MQFLITHIVFDCNCDDEDWTEYDATETADVLASRYVGEVWEADDEEDLIEELSCASGWCINEIDYKIVLNDYDYPEMESNMEIDYTTQD